MKKRLILMSTMALAVIFCFGSCKNTPSDDGDVTITITLDNPSIAVLAYGEPVNITGKVEASSTVTSLTFTGMSGTAGAYTAVGIEQSYAVSGTGTVEFTMSFLTDSRNITAIEVKATAGSTTETAYITVGSVEGEATVSVYFNSSAILMADDVVFNHENYLAFNPDATENLYPEPNTGASSDTPSFFSIHGVEIDGEVKHILSVDEVRSVEGAGVSYIFGNVLQNTINAAYIASQRGFFFMDISNLSSGTIGRQCDAYMIDGKAIDPNLRDIAVLKAVPGSWSSSYDDETYRFVDALFLSLSAAPTTEAERLHAFNTLRQIQLVLDNSKLGEENNPTSLGGANLVRHLANAGDNAAALAVDYTENFQAGDYIIIRSEVSIDEENSEWYYGIMQIMQIPNWQNALVEIEDTSTGTMRWKLDRELTKNLFKQPLTLNIKTQIKL